MKNDNIRRNKLVNFLLPLLVGVAVMVWVYRDFDFNIAAQVLLHMNMWWMILSLVFGILAHVLRGVRWKLALYPLDEHPRTRVTILAVFMSYATNLVIPRVGEVSRCAVLAKKDGVSFSRSLGTLLTERLLDAFCVVLILLVPVVFQTDMLINFIQTTGVNWPSPQTWLTSYGFYITIVCIALVVLLLYLIAKWLRIVERIKGVAQGIWIGIRSIRNVRRAPLYGMETMLIWICYFLQFYLTFYCFDFTAQLGLWAGLLAFVAGTFAVLVPTPNGAGPWHVAVIAALMLYGVDKQDAGIFALLVHGAQTLLIIILGIYASVALSTINKKTT